MVTCLLVALSLAETCGGADNEVGLRLNSTTNPDPGPGSPPALAQLPSPIRSPSDQTSIAAFFLNPLPLTFIPLATTPGLRHRPHCRPDLNGLAILPALTLDISQLTPYTAGLVLAPRLQGVRILIEMAEAKGSIPYAPQASGSDGVFSYWGT